MVEEILWLPELTPMAGASEYMVGVFNFWGKIVPVMDLDLRFGHRPHPYRLTDQVIVLEQGSIEEQQGPPLVGIIVSEVEDVRSIPSAEIEAAPAYGREGENRSGFVTRMAKLDEAIILLLDHTRLVRPSASIEGLSGDEGGAGLPFCPEATPEERAIFRERARNLMRPTDSQDVTGLIPLAVVGLSGEYFGVDLEVVREFADIHKIASIPCCPEHILGHMNLRGDIVTLVDIRRPLKMPLVSAHTAAKAMVVQLDNLLVGVPVDEVFDVIYFHPSDITGVPTAVQSESKAYLKGTAPYGGKMLSILDLPKLLTSEELVVDEDV